MLCSFTWLSPPSSSPSSSSSLESQLWGLELLKWFTFWNLLETNGTWKHILIQTNSNKLKIKPISYLAFFGASPLEVESIWCTTCDNKCGRFQSYSSSYHYLSHGKGDTASQVFTNCGQRSSIWGCSYITLLPNTGWGVGGGVFQVTFPYPLTAESDIRNPISTSISVGRTWLGIPHWLQYNI